MEETEPPRDNTRDGTIIAGRYRVERLIARGGMATVYLGRQLGLERAVALKLLTPPAHGAEEGGFAERFRLEASTLASLDHAHIVVLYDFGTTDDGIPYLAMEHVEGPRLTDLLRDGPLSVERTLSLVLQICRGLRYAHKKGIVHRDLKPSNLLVRQDDNGDHVKIVDFGLVKLADDDQSITRTGLVLGSPHCMSPEQVRGGPIDHRSDIYALGVLLFRCVSGSYPFHGASSTATMMAHLNDPVPSLSAHAAGVVLPDGLESLVTRCLQKQPEQRFTDMAELLAALQNVSGNPDATATQHVTVTRAVPRARSRSWVPALLLALVLAASSVTVGGLLLGTWWATRPPASAPVAAPIADPAPVVAPEPDPPPPDVPLDPVPVAPEPPSPGPAPTPAPVRPRLTPPPPKPVPPAEPTAPEGYLELPDDLK